MIEQSLLRKHFEESMNLQISDNAEWSDDISRQFPVFEWRQNTEHKNLVRRRRGQHLTITQRQMLTKILRDYSSDRSIIMKDYKLSKSTIQSLLSVSSNPKESFWASNYTDESKEEYPDTVVETIERDIWDHRCSQLQ